MGDSKKRVGVAVDFSPCSRRALIWAVDNLLRPGDHLILLPVLPDNESGQMQLWETTGSPLISLKDFSDSNLMKKYELRLDDETLNVAATASEQKQVTVAMKIFWGDPRDKLCESVDKVPLDCIVLGNRGLGSLQRAIMGSVSNYVVNNASCPVTVVKSQP